MPVFALEKIVEFMHEEARGHPRFPIG